MSENKTETTSENKTDTKTKLLRTQNTDIEPDERQHSEQKQYYTILNSKYICEPGSISVSIKHNAKIIDILGMSLTLNDSQNILSINC